ncbi:MAG TPA: YqaA family protein [Methyloceanibacter sp.]|nr:YqaA family protein [Methyloceanibacter sp.]
MLRRAYDKTMELAAHRNAPLALAGVSFVESSVFPIPPDVMLIPMVLAERRKAWWYATICTVASVVGGALGYVIGYFLFESIGEPILRLYGYEAAFEDFARRYNDYGAWIVFFAGLTPFPYKVITIASGVTQLNFLVFMLASVAARGLRFFVVAALLYWFGPPIKDFIERYLGTLFTIFVVLLFGGFVLVRYVF